MGIARIVVLLIAAIAAIGAAFVVKGITGSKPAPVAAVEPTVIEAPMSLVLVAGSDLDVGQRVSPSQLAWINWPESALSKTFLTKDDNPEALEEYAGAIARVRIAKNEPITGRKLINSGDAGFMAAVLAPGMRAVAVEIDVHTAAGGFILPNDRVDIIVTREVEIQDGSDIRTAYISNTIFENVRVLAIDQTYREVDDEQVVVGSTATMELNGSDAVLLARADAAGDISLALRSVADASFEGEPGASRSAGMMGDDGDQVKLYKYGKSSQVGLQ